ncbi:MAG: potassium transporter TrkG, partial [Chloroflexota bacterium]
GFMTASTFLFSLVGRRIGLADRLVLSMAYGEPTLGSIVRLARHVVVATAIAEGIGAVILFFRFSWTYPFGTAAWMGVFHSVSAFNNAGFDVVGGFRSLIPFNSDPIIVLTIASLVIVGGLGYTVILTLRYPRAYRYLALDTRLVLLVTISLLVSGTFGILVLEFTNPATLGPMNLPLKTLNAFFMATTPRTAGFNTVEVGQMTEGSLLFIIGLMFIGGGAGSPAGGIKVGTFGVLAAAVWSAMQGRRSVVIFNRELPANAVGRALAVALLGLGLVFLVAVTLTTTENYPVLPLLFEVTSAFGTVGLSTGLTPDLSMVGQLLIITTMYVGRLGPLTTALALAQRRRPETFKYPESFVRIG